MKVTIHQPDMLPWLGFFNKINNADVWVILDHTKNNPRDASFWGRRVKIMVQGQAKWLSLPLVKPETQGQIGVPINEMLFNVKEAKLFEGALRTIRSSYAKTKFFNDFISLAETFLLSKEQNMCRRNLSFIFEAMQLLEISTKVVYSSELGCTQSSTPLLVEILKKVDGKTYLCGGGAGGYQDDNLFKENGIELEYNNFIHPLYNQTGTQEFIPGLSIIDALMQVGPEVTRELIKG